MSVSHTVEVRTGPIGHEIQPAQLDRFAASLFEDKTIVGPAVMCDSTVNALEIRASVDTSRTADAITVVVRAVERALRAAHVVATQGRIDAWPDIEGVEWPDELVNGGEVARRLGISRERLRQLVSEKPTRIPPPIAQTERDRIWRWGDVAEWAAVNQRKARSPRRKKKSAGETIDLVDALKRSIARARDAEERAPALRAHRKKTA